MPEGDTVHLAARRLDEALRGRTLTKSDVRVPAFATSDLSGSEVLEVVARGKHLLFRTSAGITLHTHFGMDGAWHLYRPGERWQGPSHEVRVVLEAADRVAVGFRLKTVELVRTARESEVVGHLGPDVLGPDWDPDVALRRLTADPSRPIGDVLLDQSVMAGPGNIYRNEICFLVGADPGTPVGSLANPVRVVDLTKRLMEANRDTGNQVTTGDRRRGFENWVYGRGGRPCRRCGTPVVRTAGPAERVLYTCPSCQPVR